MPTGRLVGRPRMLDAFAAARCMLAGRHDEHTVVFALDFLKSVAHEVQKIQVGDDDRASMLNAITACDLLIVCAWASALRAAELLHPCVT